jgi:hypothetical protein
MIDQAIDSRDQARASPGEATLGSEAASNTRIASPVFILKRDLEESSSMS